jgi:hypothetical protein
MYVTYRVPKIHCFCYYNNKDMHLNCARGYIFTEKATCRKNIWRAIKPYLWFDKTSKSNILTIVILCFSLVKIVDKTSLMNQECEDNVVVFLKNRFHF